MTVFMDDQSLRDKFGKRNSAPHLPAFLDKLEASHIDNLPFEERAKVIQHLTSVILRESNEKRFYVEDKAGLCVFEEPFSREISQIKRMLESLTHSDRFKKWAFMRADDLAVELKRVSPPKKREAVWDKADLEQRITILEELVKVQAKIFSKGAMDLLPSQVVLMPIDEQNSSTAGFIKNKALDLPHLKNPDIHLNLAHILTSSFNRVASTVIHEQFHAFATQFAIAAYHGYITKTHPMSYDADILKARREYKAIGTHLIRSVYAIDDEEKTASALEKTFTGQYSRTFLKSLKNWLSQAQKAVLNHSP